jgi:hypothetical protein
MGDPYTRPSAGGPVRGLVRDVDADVGLPYGWD